MADLEALQREFMSVQETRVKRKIPERMAMEIVQLAATTHPLFKDNPLLHSLNGRDFLTKSRLREEIRDEIRLSKGRALIDELPSQLQVGAEHIQSCLSQITKESQYHLVGGHQIVTEDYIQRYLWPEINSQIDMRGGYTLITEVANALDLPLSFIKRILNRQDLAQGKNPLTLTNNLLYSQQFVETLKSTLKAFVQAVLRPVTLSQLLERFRKHILAKSNEQVYLDESFYRDLMNELINTGAVKGFISQGIYTSKAFIQLQRRMVKELFNKKRIVEYSFLKNECKISKPKDFIRDNLEGGVFLAHAYIHQTVIDETYALIQEVCSSKEETKTIIEAGGAKKGKKSAGGGCINLENTLSVNLGAQDVDEIMEKYPKRSRLTVIETFVMNRELVKELEELFEEPAKKFADILEKKGMLLEPEKKKKGYMVVAKKKIQSSKLIPNEEEIKDMIKKSGGLWKRLKGELQSLEQEDAFLRAISGHLQVQVNQLYFKQAIVLAEEILSQKATDSYYMHKKRPAPSQGEISGSMGQSLKELEMASPSELNSQIEREIHVLQQAKKVLEFMEKKKEIVGEEKKIQLVAEIEQILREKYLFRLLNKLTFYQAIHSKVKLDALAGLTRVESGASIIASDKDRATVQKQFATQHTRQVFKQLEVLANDGGIILFLEFLKEELCNLAVSIRMLDKKSEKAMVTNEKAFLKQQLETEDEIEKDAFEEEEEVKEDIEDIESMKTKLIRCGSLYSLSKDGLWLKWLFELDESEHSSQKLELCKQIVKMSTIAKEGTESFKLKIELVDLIESSLKKAPDTTLKQAIVNYVKEFVVRMGKY